MILCDTACRCSGVCCISGCRCIKLTVKISCANGSGHGIDIVVILLRLNAARGAAPRLSPAYHFLSQWEIMAFAVNVALRHRVVSEECYAVVMVNLS